MFKQDNTVCQFILLFHLSVKKENICSRVFKGLTRYYDPTFKQPRPQRHHCYNLHGLHGPLLVQTISAAPQNPGR